MTHKIGKDGGEKSRDRSLTYNRTSRRNWGPLVNVSCQYFDYFRFLMFNWDLLSISLWWLTPCGKLLFIFNENQYLHWAEQRYPLIDHFNFFRQQRVPMHVVVAFQFIFAQLANNKKPAPRPAHHRQPFYMGLWLSRSPRITKQNTYYTYEFISHLILYQIHWKYFAIKIPMPQRKFSIIHKYLSKHH